MDIYLKNVNKIINGKKVLDDITVSFTGGKIYGIVGENGSGKTMLIRAISGLIRIDSGDILIDNENIRKSKKDTGIMIENMGLYPELSAFENLKYLTGLNKKVKNEIINEYIDMVGLNSMDRRAIRKYSLGMKQRLLFAQAIFEQPDLLLLDEPTNALDEEGISLVKEILIKMRNENRIIIISSHNKDFINGLADIKYKMTKGEIEENEI